MAPGEVGLRDGRTLAYAEFGDPNGTPVIYLHGAKSSRNEAGLYGETALSSGVRILATDRPGCGDSSPHPGRTMLGYGDDLTQLADALGLGRVVVAGMSNGGAFAMAAAYAMGARVRGVIAINSTSPVADAKVRRAVPRSARFAYLMMRVAPHLLAKSVAGQGEVTRRKLGHDGALFDDAAIVAQLEQVEADVAGPYARAYLAEEMRLGAAPWGFDHRAVTQPAAIFTGDKDAGAAYARVWATELPNAELHVIPGGHVGFLAPAARDEIVRVMAQLSQRETA